MRSGSSGTNGTVAYPNPFGSGLRRICSNAAPVSVSDASATVVSNPAIPNVTLRPCWYPRDGRVDGLAAVDGVEWQERRAGLPHAVHGAVQRVAHRTPIR